MSLRARLLIAVGAVAIVALVVADVATYGSLRSFMIRRVDQSLDAVHVGLERGERRPGPRDGGGRRFGPPRDQNVANVAPGTFVQRRDASGAVVGTTTPARLPGGTEVSPKLPAKIALFDQPEGEDRAYLTVPSEGGGPDMRIRASALSDGGQLVVGVPLADTTSTLNRLLLIELFVTLLAVLAAVAIGFWLVRVGLRPLSTVEQTANAISRGEFDRRVPGDDASTEVGHLARALNTMLERIEEAFAQRDRTEQHLRRFVADASHELRTPIAAVSAYGEMFERGASARPADTARVIKGIREETARMSDLVEDLLLLARLDDQQPLEKQPLDLVALAGAAVETARTVGPQWPLELSAAKPVEVIGDGSRLRQVIDNLLANVRAHTPQGTRTVVTIGENGTSALMSVADNGPGLDAEELDRVFERFYRADASRSRQGVDGRHGGAGLGLGIVAAIVGAHGGDVRAASSPDGGVTFTVRLPLSS